MSLVSIDWLNILKPEFSKPYYINLYNFVNEEYNSGKIFPPKNEIFTAFNRTNYKDVKVVILGQDPYHGDGQAMGLAFSVNNGVAIPPSLVNIYKELHDDVGVDIPNHGNISCLTSRGVLLLNTVLTVRAHEPNSHRGIGWEKFTDAAIKAVNDGGSPVVFMLWGANAIAKESLITNTKHLILKAPHPSPLSAYRGFFGCKHFSKANEFFIANGMEPINWEITK